MIGLKLVLMILGLVCLFLAAAGVSGPRGVNLEALGLALWLLAVIVA